MASTGQDLNIEVEGLKSAIIMAKQHVTDFKTRHFNKQREEALIHILEHSIELSEGCLVLSNKKLVRPIISITRGLMENLFLSRWITLSDENAQHYIHATDNEMKRIARVNLKNGHARILNRITGNNVTEEFLKSSWEDIDERLSIFKIASDGGLEKIYRQLYGFLSIYTHGITYGFNEDFKISLVAILAVTNVVMDAINLITSAWIVKRKKVEIDKILDSTTNCNFGVVKRGKL